MQELTKLVNKKEERNDSAPRFLPTKDTNMHEYTLFLLVFEPKVSSLFV